MIFTRLAGNPNVALLVRPMVHLEVRHNTDIRAQVSDKEVLAQLCCYNIKALEIRAALNH